MTLLDGVVIEEAPKGVCGLKSTILEWRRANQVLVTPGSPMWISWLWQQLDTIEKVQLSLSVSLVLTSHVV